MTTPHPIVFLLDVDNTLLDNDTFADELGAQLKRLFGYTIRDFYWETFAKLRHELGYADYLATVQRLRDRLDDDPKLLEMSAWLLNYPFAERLYPQALKVIAHLRRIGKAVILSDGDLIFQPRKIQRAGLWEAFDEDVLIYVHKQERLAAVQRHYPAAHYVMVDDKLPILAAMKEVMGRRLTTIFPRQGHYALHPESDNVQPADFTIESIAELLEFDWSSWVDMSRR
jgi:FMN phosphatase YigB (HAD superfamily)